MVCWFFNFLGIFSFSNIHILILCLDPYYLEYLEKCVRLLMITGILALVLI